MFKNKKLVSGVLTAALSLSLFTACGSSPARADSSESLSSLITLPVSTAVSTAESVLSGDEIAVSLSDNGSTCESDGVSISGSTVTITAAGDYVLTGSLSDGQIVINAPEDAKVKLVLSGVSIVKSGHAAIYAVSADKLVIATVEGSENLLQSVGEFVQTDDSNVDAAIFAKCDVTLSGLGVLNVSCLTGHAIVSKDDLKLKSGTVNLEAANKGLYGNDSVTIENGTLNADVGTDGIYAENTESTGAGATTIQSGDLNLLCHTGSRLLPGLCSGRLLRITPGAHLPETGIDDIIGHLVLPEIQGSRNTGLAQIVRMVVRQTEHVPAGVIQRPAVVARRGERRIAAGLDLVVDHALDIDPVHLVLPDLIGYRFIGIGKIIAVRHGAPGLCLVEEPLVDQIVAGSRKADRIRIDDRRRRRRCRGCGRIL